MNGLKQTVPKPTKNGCLQPKEGLGRFFSIQSCGAKSNPVIASPPFHETTFQTYTKTANQYEIRNKLGPLAATAQREGLGSMSSFFKF
jgi:hypothetical protein